jgi:hypothetical protein
VFPFQRKCAFAVRLAVEAGGLEAGFVVTGRAVGAGRARCELAFVRIFMAVPATLVRDGAVEVGAFVTLGARHGGVFFL